MSQVNRVQFLEAEKAPEGGLQRNAGEAPDLEGDRSRNFLGTEARCFSQPRLPETAFNEKSISKLGLSSPTSDPKSFTRLYRLFLLGLLTLCASIDPMASTSFYPALADVADALQTSKSVANLCSSLDFAGVACTALYWSHVCQYNGRKPVLTISLALVLLFTIIGALATSVTMLIAARVLSSASAAGIIITGVGAAEDMWETREKGFALGVYFLGPMACPALGPVIGGALVRQWGWRAIPAFIAALAGVMLICVIMILPETKSAALPQKNSIAGNESVKVSLACRMRKATYRWFIALYRAMYRPLLRFRYLRYPMVLTLLVVAGFSYSLTSILSVTMQSVFSSEPFSFNALSVGLLFLPYASGTILASVVGGKISDRIMRQRDSVLLPENRIRGNALAACSMQLLALPALGWVMHFQVPWWAMVAPAIMLGMSCGLNLGIATTVLVELIPTEAAGLIALNSLGRNLSGALGGSIAQPLLDKIGAGWLFTGLAALCILNLVAIVSLLVKGREWREKIWRNEASEESLD